MTPEERAAIVMANYGPDDPGVYVKFVIAIRAAVAEEREACAKIADEYEGTEGGCAKAIRGRS